MSIIIASTSRRLFLLQQSTQARQLCRWLGQVADAGATSFVLDANTASLFRCIVKKPEKSPPDLAGVVFTRGENRIAGVVECARKKLIIVTRHDLQANSIFGYVTHVPQSRCFIARRGEYETAIRTEANL